MAEIFATELHPAQREIWAEGIKHQYNVVRCGRRWGKTEILGTIAVSYATSLFPSTKNPNKLQGGRVGIFTAEYKQQQEIFDYLEEALEPLIKKKSRSDGRIRLKNGARIDFWVTNNNPLAGRGREYDVVLIDEAAFTKSPEMLEEIWPKSIKPTLLTRRGRAWVFSTPNGTDDKNFFYAICHDPKHGFKEHYAPTSSNPFAPPDELEKERLNNDPRVFRQEYLAEFIDWSAEALLDINKLMVNDLPVEMPTTCDIIFAVMDTALKGGTENDGTGIVYFAYEKTYSEPRLTIIDYDCTQIKASLLPEYMPGVYDNLERLAKICRPRLGSQGVFMEDAAMGAILNQKAETEGWDMTPIKSALTGKGKDERGVLASGHHYLGKCKITKEAYDKTVTFKQVTANHLIKQIAGFHLADPKAHKRADDLFDCYTYGLIIVFGNYEAL
ncbi:terminase [Salmonella enterica subsp. enterica serovar Hull]|uniref:Terminase n=1 Tax=Salmonella enterica subsp. enterica serovar Hull TaxID=1403564 RepID=A0A5X4PE50_SALET|nr:terminase family protein [Citrobacter sedlakii]EBZ7585865.1 terminase [Salmonella enterica subsp. enterica serovar Hull]ECC3814906.1 terminase [Salmonella enterica subsp. enterica]ECC8734494.1 terminase [Salmonella bongori]ECF2938619.1 terminase [Salmonella enterica subsp. enterica serovar Reading]ECN6005599.1 terminase [Salmonella enterica subsp. enterica serovar Brandenburg]EDA0852612.1 terminase [Salmonella enterica]